MEDRLVEAEVGNETFELAILLAQLAQLAELAEAQGAEALLPPIERLLADAELAADLADRRAGLPWRKARAICSSVNLLVFIGAILPPGAVRASADRSLAQTESRAGVIFGEEGRGGPPISRPYVSQRPQMF